MDTIQLIRMLFGSMDSEYIQENDDKIIELLEQAANTLEKLAEENKQLRTDLIMQTALAQNRQTIIENDKQLAKRFEALLRDFKEVILHPDNTCVYCKNYQPCKGEECESYIKGRGVKDLKGYMFDWQWSCEDFDFGECPKLENTPCHNCIKNNMQGFEWRGV